MGFFSGIGFTDVLPTIGGIANSLYNTFTGQRQSKELMKYQYELNQRAVEQQNRYNSPLAQMERLREAGLNPNLVYGNGVDGNQSSAPNVGIANRSQQADFGLAEMASNIFRNRQLENETKLADANRDKLIADKLLSTARYLDTMQDVARKDATFDIYVEKAAADLKHTYQSIEESKQRVENMQETIQQIRANVQLLKAKTGTERLRPSEIRAHINLMREQGLTSRKNREVMDSIIRLNDRKIEDLFYHMMYLSSLGEKVDLENEMTKKMRQFGLQGVSGKDLLNFLKDFLIGLIKS